MLKKKIMNKTLELLHAACLALSITVSAAAKFLIQWCSPLHGGSELGGTRKLDLTLQTESHTLCRDGEDCPTVPLPDDQQHCNLTTSTVADWKTSSHHPCGSIWDDQAKLKSLVGRKKRRERSSLQRGQGFFIGGGEIKGIGMKLESWAPVV